MGGGSRAEYRPAGIHWGARGRANGRTARRNAGQNTARQNAVGGQRDWGKQLGSILPSGSPLGDQRWSPKPLPAGEPPVPRF